MKLVTVATKSDAYFPWLLLSCERNNISLNVLGWGEKWQGFNWRNKLVLQFVADLSDDEIVCFIDAFDVIVLRDFENFDKQFWAVSKKVGSEFIVSAEIIKSFRAKIGSYYFGKCNGYNINAGSYVGTVRKIKEILGQIRTLNPKNDADDQVLLSKYCRQYPTNIYIDSNGIFFKSIVKPLCNIQPYFDLEQDDLVGNGCYILHANYFTRLDKILEFQGYPFHNNDKRAITNYILHTTVRKWWWVFALEIVFYITAIYIIIRCFTS